MENIQNWNQFMVEFSDKILPIYETHELTFDKHQIHGRLHVARSIIFAEYMGRFNIKTLKNDIDLNKIRYAVSFHDSGRQGNGVDLWEEDSAENCYNYLISKKLNKKYAAETANMIIKSQSLDPHKIIVTDADVIEIMRPVCGHGGISGFNPNYLNFLKFRNNMVERTELIKESWLLISYTEEKLKSSNNLLYDIIDIIENDTEKYKLLNSF